MLLRVTPRAGGEGLWAWGEMKRGGTPGRGQDVLVRVQGEENIRSPPAGNALRAEPGEGHWQTPWRQALRSGCSGLNAQKDPQPLRQKPPRGMEQGLTQWGAE